MFAGSLYDEQEIITECLLPHLKGHITMFVYILYNYVKETDQVGKKCDNNSFWKFKTALFSGCFLMMWITCTRAQTSYFLVNHSHLPVNVGFRNEKISFLSIIFNPHYFLAAVESSFSPETYCLLVPLNEKISFIWLIYMEDFLTVTVQKTHLFLPCYRRKNYEQNAAQTI